MTAQLANAVRAAGPTAVLAVVDYLAVVITNTRATGYTPVGDTAAALVGSARFAGPKGDGPDPELVEAVARAERQLPGSTTWLEDALCDPQSDLDPGLMAALGVELRQARVEALAAEALGGIG